MEKLNHCITTSLFHVIMPFDSNDNYARSGIGLLHELVKKKDFIYSCSSSTDLKSLKRQFDHLCCCQNKCVLSWCWLLSLAAQRSPSAWKNRSCLQRRWADMQKLRNGGVHFSPSRGRTRLAAYNQVLTSHTGCVQGFPNIIIQIWDAVFIIVSFKTDLSWSAAAPSVRSGWPWLDRHQPAGSTCGLTAARWSPLQCHHPPCTAPCWCARWWHCGMMKRGH